MKINNNMQAMNAARQLNVNSNSAAKSMEKLSSGYRINRAGDDAAGLAISEKMRGQIRGLNQASKNSQEGISLIQTAEAALNETHSVLQRMRELAVQAATGTLEDDDRVQINEEFQALKDEVQQISEQTQFNKMTLLGGGFSATGVFDTAVDGATINASTAKGGTYELAVTGTTLSVTLNNITVSGIEVASGKGTIEIAEFGITIETDADFTHGDLDGKEIEVSGNAVTLQIGANKGEELSFSIADMSSQGLQINSANTSDATNASNAIDTIENAIKLVSDERAKLGAAQNRLEYKIKNLNSSAENLQSAESGIRDVDMASEMVNYTKNEILQQAAQAMLAKANMAPQNILQLLR